MNYYTPEIEEFYVGFEYEAFDHLKQVLGKSEPIDKRWYKTKILLSTPNDLNHCRVKYLDKEDIESLGFKIIESNNILHCTMNSVEIFTYQPIKNKLLISGLIYDIKNKSELKKLMKQLNIIK